MTAACLLHAYWFSLSAALACCHCVTWVGWELNTWQSVSNYSNISCCRHYTRADQCQKTAATRTPAISAVVAISDQGVSGILPPPTIASAPPRLLLIKVVHWSYRLIDSICDSTMNQSVQQRGSNAPKHTNFDRKWAWFTKISRPRKRAHFCAPPNCKSWLRHWISGMYCSTMTIVCCHCVGQLNKEYGFYRIALIFHVVLLW